MSKQKSVLFLIRDKMGDSLIAANVALLFAKTNPEWRVSILMREAYSHAIANEERVEVKYYRNGLHAGILAWWWRISRRHFDVLAVLRGYGKRTYSLAKGIPARRKVVHEPFLAELATDCVEMPPSEIETPHYEPALRVAQALAPGLVAPARIHFDALASKWKAAPKKFVLICPLSDELRRNIPTLAIDALYERLRESCPDLEVRVLARNEKEILALKQIPRTPVIFFRDIPDLIEILLNTAHYYGTDTGLLHLAAGMGLPCTVFFGPTQPHRVMPLEQPNFVALRAQALGSQHCDLKACTSASCIASVVGDHVGRDLLRELPPALQECPLLSKADSKRNCVGSSA